MKARIAKISEDGSSSSSATKAESQDERISFAEQMKRNIVEREKEQKAKAAAQALEKSIREKEAAEKKYATHFTSQKYPTKPFQQSGQARHGQIQLPSTKECQIR